MTSIFPTFETACGQPGGAERAPGAGVRRLYGCRRARSTTVGGGAAERAPGAGERARTDTVRWAARRGARTGAASRSDGHGRRWAAGAAGAHPPSVPPLIRVPASAPARWAAGAGRSRTGAAGALGRTRCGGRPGRRGQRTAAACRQNGRHVSTAGGQPKLRRHRQPSCRTLQAMRRWQMMSRRRDHRLHDRSNALG